MKDILIKPVIIYTDFLAYVGERMVSTVDAGVSLIPGELINGFKRSEPYSLENVLKGYDHYPTSGYMQHMQRVYEKIGLIPYHVGREARKLVDTLTRYEPPQPEQ